MAEHALPPARHELSDVSFRFLVWGACLVLTTILLCALGVMWLYPTIPRDHRLTSPLPVYPAPRLQAQSAADLQNFQKQELAQLNSYGWIDKDHGIVHIPIEEAMRRIAAQGIPDWPISQGAHR